MPLPHGETKLKKYVKIKHKYAQLSNTAHGCNELKNGALAYL